MDSFHYCKTRIPQLQFAQPAAAQSFQQRKCTSAVCLNYDSENIVWCRDVGTQKEKKKNTHRWQLDLSANSCHHNLGKCSAWKVLSWIIRTVFRLKQGFNRCQVTREMCTKEMLQISASTASKETQWQHNAIVYDVRAVLLSYDTWQQEVLLGQKKKNDWEMVLHADTTQVCAFLPCNRRNHEM